ncbi:MAG: hypothetical protein MJ209_00305 [archaeon]|nr:hypothetical protein [archaeon]
MNDETKLVKTDNTYGINLFSEQGIATAELVLKKLMASEKSGIKSVADGMAIMLRANDLKLPFSTCVEHIHVINGKTGVDVHIVKALLSKAGVVWEQTKDAAPLYKYTDGSNVYLEHQLPSYCRIVASKEKAEAIKDPDVLGVWLVKYYSDLSGNIFSEFEINDKCVIALNKLQAISLQKEGKYPIIRIPQPPYDYVTEYKFTRHQLCNGKELVRTATSKFTYSEGKAAGLFEKDTYKKYPRTLISHRAFALGARDIASDLIMGCMEETELNIMCGESLSDDILQQEI